MSPTRLNRYLARRGVASRRGADHLIEAGRVTVNGVTAVLGMAVDPERDQVAVDGRKVDVVPRTETLMLNKPQGVVSTTRDPQGRPTVMSLLGGAEHAPGLAPVGRLDADSRGLLLISSDGDLAHRLTHPRFGVVKRYRIILARPPSPEDLERLVRGRRLEDGWAQAISAHRPDPRAPAVLEVEMGEGRKREVRRLCAALGMEVRDLVRVGFGPLRLGTLEEGRWRRLTLAEQRALRSWVGGRETGEPHPRTRRHPGTARARTSPVSAGVRRP